MSDPVCCGEPMDVVEYDPDEDYYSYRCAVNPDHTAWFVDDEETWK